MPFGVVLGQVLFMTTAGTLLSQALRNSALGREATSPAVSGGVAQQTRVSGSEGNARMASYEIIGDDDIDDDDDVGGIGADYLIGEDDDDVLEDLVSGDGMSEIVGARRHRRGRRAGRRTKAVIRRSPTRERRYPLGFTPTDIATTVTSTIAANPQSLYRPERLIIPSEIAPDLGVVDVKVGTQSQFAQNTEVPAGVFSEVAIDAYVQFDSAEVGNQVYLQIRNKSAGTVNFTAALIGTVAK